MDELLKNNFKVKIGEVEGPLELVLDLIEKRKLHISDVSLSQIADEFIEYIKSFEKFPMRDSADFILVASTLLLIKSKSLLPNLSLTPEEQINIEDLENRLTAYKKYKELSINLAQKFGNFLYFAREKRNINIVFAPANDINISSLKDALAEVLKNAPQKTEGLPKIAITKIISLEEMIDRLSDRIKTSLRTSFSDFAKSSPDKKGFSAMDKVEKVNVIVSFLAMLELVKQGMVRADQDNHFEDIRIESENTGVPSYY